MAALAALGSLSIGHAEPAAAGYTIASIDNFYGFCLNEGFDARKAIELAEFLEWEELDEILVDQMRPIAPQRVMKGWLISSDNHPPFFGYVGISDTHEEAELCITYQGEVDGQEFVDVFEWETDAEEVHVETRLHIIARTYEIAQLPNTLITIQTDKRERTKGVTASVLFLPAPNW